MARLRPVLNDTVWSAGAPVGARHMRLAELGTHGRRPVTHSYAALALYTGGRARIEQDGEWTVGSGDVFVVPAGHAHRCVQQQGGELWGLSLETPCFAVDDGAELLRPFESVREGGCPVVHIPAQRQSFLASLFKELATLGRAPPAMADDAVRRSLLTLIVHEVQMASARTVPVPRPTGGVVVQSLRFIERNCLGPLQLADVAAAVGRSPAHVTSALSRATGRSAAQWIISGRMAEARRLLLGSSESIESITERVGYADSTHFIRMFRRHHGQTPAAWRALERRRPDLRSACEPTPRTPHRR